MKKIISALLIFAVLFGCVPGLADALTTDRGITADLSVKLNDSTLFQFLQADADTAGAVFSLINNLNVRIAVKGQSGQLDITLKNKPLVSFGCGEENGGYTMVCDLMPNYAFHLSAEALQQITREMTEALPANIDVTGLVGALVKPLDDLIDAVSKKVGETEIGNYTVDGYSFNTRIPVNITQKEAEILLLQCARQIAADPAAEPLLGLLVTRGGYYSGSVSEYVIAQIDQSIADTEQYGSDEPINIEIYGDVNVYGVASKTCAVIKTIPSTTFYVGQMDNRFILKAVEENGDHLIYFALEDTEKGALVTFQYREYGTDVTVRCDLTDRGDGGFESKTDVYYNSDAPLGTLILNVASGADITLAPVSAGKTVIDFEQLASGSAPAVQTAVVTALPTLLNRARDAMPEEIGVLMKMLNLGGAFGGF